MVQEAALEEIARDTRVLVLGIYGSRARGVPGADFDILAIVSADEEEIREKLLKAGYDAIVTTAERLKESDPVFLLALSKDYKPLKGQLELPAKDPKTEMRLLHYSFVSYLRFRETLRKGEFVGAVALAGYNATRYAAWFLLNQKGESLPANSSEILKSLLHHTTPALAQLFQKSILGTTPRLTALDYTHLDNEKVLYTLIAVSEALKMALDPFQEAEKWLQHVERRLAEIQPDDMLSIRELCQGLFLIIYNLTRGYIARRRGYAPEVHIEIFHVLNELDPVDSHAREIENTYREAFNQIHINCHYRGIGDREILRNWVDRAKSFHKYVTSIT